MGLDTSHDCWHGAYSAFTRWRDKLGELAGYTYHYDVRPYEKDGMRMAHVSDHRVTPDIDWGNIEQTIGADLNGRWPLIPVRPDGTPDPLIILIAHSDCEGRIQHEFCGALADRLEGFLPELAKLDDDGGHIGNWEAKTQKFIDGLREASRQGQDVTFG